MDIDRHVDQGGLHEAIKRVKFCLDQLEKAKDFSKGLDWDSEICHRLTVEEIIGALVVAGQVLLEEAEKK